MSSLKRKAGAADLASAADPKKVKQQQQSSLRSFFGTAGSSAATAKAASKTTPTPTPTTPTAAKAAVPASAPVRAPAPPSATDGPFDKDAWVAGLTKEQRQLLKLEIDTLDESWLALLKDDVTSASFLELKRYLCREHDAGRKIFPPAEDVYAWSRYTPFDKVKVVILGQDPYHNDGQAHGLAFSVKPPVKAPPSLRNMYLALKKDYPDTFQAPPNGALHAWAARGVLLLNTCLTVRAHEANSHSNHGWERFTQRVIELVAARRTRGVVFMAWGSPAAKRVLKIDAKTHLVLRSVHPSPLSAHRGFFDCRHFRTANEWLVERYGASGEVDWSLVPGTSTLEGAHGGTADDVKEEDCADASEKTDDDDDDGNQTEVDEPSTVATPVKTGRAWKEAVVADDEKENAAVEAWADDE